MVSKAPPTLFVRPNRRYNCKEVTYIVTCTKLLHRGDEKSCINVQPHSQTLTNLHPDMPNQRSIMMSFPSRINLHPEE